MRRYSSHRKRLTDTYLVPLAEGFLSAGKGRESGGVVIESERLLMMRWNVSEQSVNIKEEGSRGARGPRHHFFKRMRERLYYYASLSTLMRDLEDG